MKLNKMRPTRLGLYLFGLNTILLILAIGYSNNLLFLFSLILLTQTLFWFTDTLNFSHSSIKDIQVSNCYFGELTVIGFSADEARISKVKVTINNKKYEFKHLHFSEGRYLISLALDKRGKYLIDSISFYDSRPYGLFAKKIEIAVNGTFYVYPQLLENLSIDPVTQAATESGMMDSHLKGEESFLGLAQYQGEDFKKISWKHYARTEDILVKQGLSPVLPHLDLDLKPNPSEYDLSYVATLMNLAHKNQFAFSFKFKDLYIPPESGVAHLQLCLERLSEC